jgi:uncharacterized cupin superfamily protein
MAASWQRLGDAVGCKGIGVSRLHIDAGRLSTPPHSHGASEEIVFVLGESGLSTSSGPATASSISPTTRSTRCEAGRTGSRS